MVVGEGSDGAEVPAVKSQDGIRSKFGSKGNIDGIGEIEPEAEVASSNGLRGIKCGGCYRGQHRAARAYPVPDVIDGLMGSVTAEDPTRDVINFAEQHGRDDQSSGSPQYLACAVPVWMTLIESGQQSRRIGYDDDQVAEFLLCS